MVRCLFFALVLGNLLSLRNVFPSIGWLSEINQNCGDYYLLIHLVTMVMLSFRLVRTSISKSIRMAVLSLCVLMSLVYLDELRPFFIHSRGALSIGTAEASLSPSSEFAVVVGNVCSDNTRYDGFAAEVRSRTPDAVVLLESTPQWGESIEKLGYYPYTHFIPQVGSVGISLFSKFPLNSVMTDIGNDARPITLATLDIAPERHLKLLAFDLLPPLTDEALYANKLSLRRISTLVRHEEEPIIAFADMNATRYSRFYKSFREGARVIDAGYGFGFNNTWDMSVGWVRFKIDHLFVKGINRVTSFEAITIEGSDHRGFYAKFHIFAQ